jgi:hypothetical protein
MTGRFATRAELAKWAGIAMAPLIVTSRVTELEAMGAAIASHCNPCFP